MKAKYPLLAMLLAIPALVQAADELPGSTEYLGELVVTSPSSDMPLTVTTDPKAPRQPIPAHDGADYLKGIPGFSIIRKGGTDGDPVLRGMAGSRLSILLDGEAILGGCPNRMDPPTAYIFPAAYDRITVLKGPQTVLYGPGNSAGTVLFERIIDREKQTGMHAYGSVTAGSFGRNDEAVDVRAGNPDFYAQGIFTRSASNDYKDGNNRSVHSNYMRWSSNAAFGWTPDDNTRLELSAAKSDGEAAYADRGMDGSKFARENVGIKFEKKNLTSMLTSIEAQLYYNYIDHVMDNYSLRTFTPSMMMPNPVVSNPDRKTTGGRFSVDLAWTADLFTTIGVDAQMNKHTNRMTMNQLMMPYEGRVRSEDAQFRNYGVFGEVEHSLTAQDTIIGGLRHDRWRVEDKRTVVQAGMMALPNPTSGKVRNEGVTSGFARYERNLTSLPSATAYVGVGHAARVPDYWELFSKESTTTASAFNTRAEKRLSWMPACI